MKKAIHVCEYWWALKLLKQSSFLNLVWVEDNGKIKKTLKYKRTFCSFLQITRGSYISTDIIDKNMGNIYQVIHMSFFSYMAFFPALLYTPHKATSHFAEVCFRFVQTTVFLLLSSLLCFKFNRSCTFINAYKLYFVLVHNVYIALESVKLVPLLSSVFCYILRFLKNRA